MMENANIFMFTQINLAHKGWENIRLITENHINKTMKFTVDKIYCWYPYASLINKLNLNK